MPMQRIKTLEEKHGNLHKVIPPLVNECGQIEAGRQLGVAASTLSKWLKRNGYKSKMQYFHERKAVNS